MICSTRFYLNLVGYKEQNNGQAPSYATVFYLNLVGYKERLDSLNDPICDGFI